jgi:hypothetical protein
MPFLIKFVTVSNFIPIDWFTFVTVLFRSIDLHSWLLFRSIDLHSWLFYSDRLIYIRDCFIPIDWFTFVTVLFLLQLKVFSFTKNTMAVPCHKYIVRNIFLGLFATGDGRSVPCQWLQPYNWIRILRDSSLMASKIYSLQFIEKTDN